MNSKRPRARQLGVPFDGLTGRLNAITDVAGLEVGNCTVMSGGPTHAPEAPTVRTGVTAIHPLGKVAHRGVAAGWFALNGNGEMTGTTFIDEFGAFFGPVVLTNTLSLGIARDAVVEWSRDRLKDPLALIARTTPVAAETWDGKLNDIYGFHVGKEHVFSALSEAVGGPVAEGNVGGGTGMTAYDFKAGIGTSSRRVEAEPGTFTVGVLVQANYGKRHQLTIAGVPIGREITDLMPAAQPKAAGDGSIIVVIATDAPLLPSQLKPLAKRASLGLARNGSIAANTSGDIFLACSTANTVSYGSRGIQRFDFIPTESLDPFFSSTVEATEEAVINALLAAETMTGLNGVTYHALPHRRLQQVLRSYHRLLE
ncbi:MAG: P1 family peptidase [Trueperaceae bacterium]